MSASDAIARLRGILAAVLPASFRVSERRTQYAMDEDCEAFCELDVQDPDGFLLVVATVDDRPIPGELMLRVWRRYSPEVWLFEEAAPRVLVARGEAPVSAVDAGQLAPVAFPGLRVDLADLFTPGGPETLPPGLASAWARLRQARRLHPRGSGIEVDPVIIEVQRRMALERRFPGQGLADRFAFPPLFRAWLRHVATRSWADPGRETCVFRADGLDTADEATAADLIWADEEPGRLTRAAFWVGFMSHGRHVWFVHCDRAAPDFGAVGDWEDCFPWTPFAHPRCVQDLVAFALDA